MERVIARARALLVYLSVRETIIYLHESCGVAREESYLAVVAATLL